MSTRPESYFEQDHSRTPLAIETRPPWYETYGDLIGIVAGAILFGFTLGMVTVLGMIP